MTKFTIAELYVYRGKFQSYRDENIDEIQGREP